METNSRIQRRETYNYVMFGTEMRQFPSSEEIFLMC